MSSFRALGEALEKLEQLAPDIIVIDFNDEVSKEIRRLGDLKLAKKKIPVIVLTDLKDNDEKKKACILGACKFLSKSKSTLGDLIQMVRKAVK